MKVGDEVRCVEATEGLTKGVVYAISAISNFSKESRGMVQVLNDHAKKEWYHPTSFEGEKDGRSNN